MTSTIIKGIGVSEGIRMGTAFVYAPLKLAADPSVKRMLRIPSWRSSARLRHVVWRSWRS